MPLRPICQTAMPGLLRQARVWSVAAACTDAAPGVIGRYVPRRSHVRRRRSALLSLRRCTLTAPRRSPSRDHGDASGHSTGLPVPRVGATVEVRPVMGAGWSRAETRACPAERGPTPRATGSTSAGASDPVRVSSSDEYTARSSSPSVRAGRGLRPSRRSGRCQQRPQSTTPASLSPSRRSWTSTSGGRARGATRTGEGRDARARRHRRCPPPPPDGGAGRVHPRRRRRTGPARGPVRGQAAADRLPPHVVLG